MTMGSTMGLIFGITNIVGNFGTVFVDQSYWQSAMAAKPPGPMGFLIGGMVWFAVPFCMATVTGIAGRAMTTHPSLGVSDVFGALYITGADSGNGLTPAKVLSAVMGPFGAFLLLLQLFVAIVSTGSAEILAVSSILTYDVYYEYINPELKIRRQRRRSIFYAVIQKFTTAKPIDFAGNQEVEQKVRLEEADKLINKAQVQEVTNSLALAEFFADDDLSAEDITRRCFRIDDSPPKQKEPQTHEQISQMGAHR